MRHSRQSRRACKGNDHNVDCTQAFEICIDDAGHHIRREERADLGHPGIDHGPGIDSGGECWETGEEDVVEE